jgi:hypothetical protein
MEFTFIVAGVVVVAVTWFVYTMKASVELIWWNLQHFLETIVEINYTLAKSYEKLAYLEKRMEEAMGDGDEVARHLMQIACEYDADVSGGALRWALRRTVEEYRTWRAAQWRFKRPASNEAWDMVMESAKRWIHDEVANTYGDQDEEGKRIMKNLKTFERYMPEYWKGYPCSGNIMEEYAKLENQCWVNAGFLKSVDEAHFVSNGVCFRSRTLREPNADLKEGSDDQGES